MIDMVQAVLLAVIVILTSVLVVLGIQVFLILLEVRKTVSKTNGILEKADEITNSVKTPLSALSSLTLGLKTSSIITLAKFVKNLLGHERDQKEERTQHGK